MHNFSAMDRLTDFGMSSSIAQQMTNSMNHAMNNVQVPRIDVPMPGQTSQPPLAAQIERMAQEAAKRPPEMVFYAMIDGLQSGPFCETEMTRLITGRKLTKDSLVWHTGMNEWQAAENVPEVLRIVATAPQSPPPPPPPQGRQ